MSCITSVSYKIANVERNFDSIVPKRGLKQRDPMSSYLFLICIERLTALFQKFENRKLISRVKVARSAPPITHMLFANNSYIFCKANPESSNNTL